MRKIVRYTTLLSAVALAASGLSIPFTSASAASKKSVGKVSKTKATPPVSTTVPTTTAPVATTATATASTASKEPPALQPYAAAPLKVVDGTTDPDAVIRVGYAAPPRVLDPAHQTNAGDQPYTWMVFDRLMQVDNRFQVQPMLATSWKFLDSGALELKLRNDVRFNDGAPFNAAAVKVNLDRARADGSSAKSLLGSITSVDVIDDYTVQVKLKPGSGAEVIYAFAITAGAMVSPKALADPARLAKLATDPKDAGSTPYNAVQLTPGEKAIYERVPTANWDEGRAGFAKRVEITFFPTASARVNGVQAGNLDLAQITGVDLANAQALVDQRVFSGRQIWVLTGQHLFFNVSKPPFNNPKARLALQYAIDRNAIGNGLLSGNCRPQTEYYGPEHPQYNPDAADLYKYNPSKAKDLLAEANASNLSFEVGYSAGSSFDLPIQAIAQQLKQIGVEVKLKPFTGTEGDLAFRRGELQAYMGTLSNSPDASILINDFFLSGYNLGANDPAGYKAIVDSANDPKQSVAARNKVYQTALLKIAQDSSYINVCQTRQMWAYGPKMLNTVNMPWMWAGLPDYRTVAKAK